MMQGQTLPGNPQFMYYNYMNGFYPNNPAMWQQWGANWYPNGCFYPGPLGFKPGQVVSPPDTPTDESIELRMADQVDMMFFNPPLPPDDSERPMVTIQDGCIPLVYDDDQSALTMEDTLGFYSRYYAYQDHKDSYSDITKPRKKGGPTVSFMDIPLPPEKAFSDCQDLNNNKETVAHSLNKEDQSFGSLLDIPLPPERETPEKAKKSPYQLPNKSKLKKKLKTKRGKRSGKAVKLKEKVKISRSDSLRKKKSSSCKTSGVTVQDSLICLSD